MPPLLSAVARSDPLDGRIGIRHGGHVSVKSRGCLSRARGHLIVYMEEGDLLLQDIVSDKGHCMRMYVEIFHRFYSVSNSPSAIHETMSMCCAHI